MTRGIKIHRQGSGPPVSFLHGWGMNAAVFEPLLDPMAQRYRVSRVDLPGYGASANIDGDFDAQVEALAEAMDGGTLVGWSMGGLYAIALAHRYPQKFTRLMLVGSNPCFVQREDWPSAMPSVVFNDFAGDLIADWQAAMRRFIGLQMHGADNARTLVREITALLLEGGEPRPGALESGLDLLLNADLRPLLETMEVPVLALLGRRDKLVPVQVAEHLPRVNPAIRVECLHQSAHAPFLSHQDVFLELFDEFVESSPAG